jgi:hypothetical protein
MEKTAEGVIVQRTGALRQGMLDFIAALPNVPFAKFT